eukprot:6180656-Pleurochrysis_carterae.AAC.3
MQSVARVSPQSCPLPKPNEMNSTRSSWIPWSPSMRMREADAPSAEFDTSAECRITSRAF